MKDVKLGSFVFFDNAEVTIVHELAKIAKAEKKNPKHAYVHSSNRPDLFSWSHMCNKFREMSRFGFIQELPNDNKIVKQMRKDGICRTVFQINKDLIFELSQAFNGTSFIGNDTDERAVIEIARYMLDFRVHLLRVIDAKAMVRNTGLTLRYINQLGLHRTVTVTSQPGKYLELTNQGILVAGAWKNVNDILRRNDKFADRSI